MDYGFKAVISPRFADIFRGNSLKAGLLTVQLAEKIVQRLWDDIEENAQLQVTVDLVEREVRWSGEVHHFDLDDYTRWRLLEGLDDIGLTLRHVDAVEEYEAKRKPWLPRVAV
jgi:3-isopropylmalate/(R)-2-methylmalate dehydratase small subunit